MTFLTRRLLPAPSQPALSKIRPARCVPGLRCLAQRCASFTPNLRPEDERANQRRAVDLSARRRRSIERQFPEPESDYEFTQRAKRPLSLKPLFVGLGICLGAFSAAEAVDGWEDTRSIEILAKRGWSTGSKQEAKEVVAANSISPFTIIDHILGTDTVRWYARHSDGARATIIIIAANSVVFFAWSLASRIPALSSRMSKSFVHWPGVTPSYTLLTSVFSHQSFAHFACNMIGLYSFGPPCFDYLTLRRITRYPNTDESGPGPRHTMNLNTTFHNVAFFISCGVCANLVPHYIKLLSTRSQTLMLSRAAPALLPTPGLGASGAVYSCLVVHSIHKPDSQIALIFLPFMPFSIGYGVPAMIAIDAVGVLSGWSRFDHLCHLSGAAIGAGAYYYGPAVWFKAQSWSRSGKISSRP